VSRRLFTACQAGASGLAPERVTYQLLHDHAGVDRVDSDLRQLGVSSPERWVKHWVPTPL
jgi:hypothetical protein